MSVANARIGALAVGLAAALMAQGCHRQGPAERAGEKIDKALGADDPGAGPAQKAGEDLDRAAKSAHDAADDAGAKAKSAAHNDHRT
jgi:hypothetical protein